MNFGKLQTCRRRGRRATFTANSDLLWGQSGRSRGRSRSAAPSLQLEQPAVKSASGKREQMASGGQPAVTVASGTFQKETKSSNDGVFISGRCSFIHKTQNNSLLMND